MSDAERQAASLPLVRVSSIQRTNPIYCGVYFSDTEPHKRHKPLPRQNVMGAIIIASPFPDEVGISLMGISQLKNWQFLVISFLLNSLGILFVVTIAKSF